MLNCWKNKCHKKTHTLFASAFFFFDASCLCTSSNSSGESSFSFLVLFLFFAFLSFFPLSFFLGAALGATLLSELEASTSLPDDDDDAFFFFSFLPFFATCFPFLALPLLFFLFFFFFP